MTGGFNATCKHQYLHSTVSNKLRKQDRKTYRMIKKPPLNPLQIIFRRRYAEELLLDVPEQELKTLFLFCDEKTFQSQPSNNVKPVRRSRGQAHNHYDRSTRSGRFSVNIIACVGNGKKGILHIMNPGEKLTSQRYVDVLRNSILPSAAANYLKTVLSTSP